MELLSHLLTYNFISAAMIIGIVIMLIENRKESPRGSEHISVIVVMLTIIVVNTELKEWFLMRVYDATMDYRGTTAMWFMYIRSTAEHILFPMIAYTLLLLIAPIKKKYITFLPELILIIAEAVNLMLRNTPPELKILTRTGNYSAKVLGFDNWGVDFNIDGEKFETIQLILDKTAEDLGLGESTISFPSYNSGTMDFSVNAAGSKEMVQKLPSLFVDNLLEETYSDNKGYYEAASYGGYTVTQSSEEGSDDEKVSFQVTIAIKGRESAYKPERDDKKSEQKAE